MLSIYQSVEVVSKDAHAQTKIKPRPDYLFSRDSRECVVTVDEFFDCAKSMPILFGKNANDQYHAFGMLGLSEVKNLFVNDKGEWLKGEYIPAFVRRYPFVFIENGDDLVLGLDTASKSTSNDDGHPLFTDAGELTPYTEGVMGFMKSYQQSYVATEKFVQTLSDMKLLQDTQVTINDGDKPLTIQGFKRINEEALDALSDKKVLKLVKSGYYKLITAHLLSLANFKKLVALK